MTSNASSIICVLMVTVNLMNDNELEILVIGISLLPVHCQTQTLFISSHQNIPVTQIDGIITNYTVYTTLAYLLVILLAMEV